MIEGWCSPGLGVESIAGQRWIAIDTETTGLSVRGDSITEFAAVRWRDGGDFDGGSVVEWRCEDEGPDSLGEKARRLDRLLASSIVVAHNLEFDLAFLRRHAATIGTRLANPPRWVCSMRASGGFVSLDHLADANEVEIADRHTARGDAVGLASIVKTLLNQLPGTESLESFRELLMSTADHRGRPRQGVDAPWSTVMDSLPHVVPVRFPTREQRAAFAEVSSRLDTGLVSSAEIEDVADDLRRVGLTAVALDRLLNDAAAAASDT